MFSCQKWKLLFNVFFLPFLATFSIHFWTTLVQILPFLGVIWFNSCKETACPNIAIFGNNLTQMFAIFGNNLIRFVYKRQFVQILPILAIIWVKFLSFLAIISSLQNVLVQVSESRIKKTHMKTIHESKSLNQKSIQKHILQHILEACKAPYPFKVVHLVSVTMLLLSIAC